MISFHRFVELMNESGDWMPDKNTSFGYAKHANSYYSPLTCPKCDGAMEHLTRQALDTVRKWNGNRNDEQYVCPRCNIVVEVPQKGGSSNMPLGSRTWQIPSDPDYHATINPGDANRIGGL